MVNPTAVSVVCDLNNIFLMLGFEGGKIDLHFYLLQMPREEPCSRGRESCTLQKDWMGGEGESLLILVVICDEGGVDSNMESKRILKKTIRGDSFIVIYSLHAQQWSQLQLL